MATERKTLEPWPLLLAGALAGMIGISVAFLCISLAHPDAVLVSDSFAAEPGIAEALRARSRGESRGWELTVRTRPEADGVDVEAVLQDAAGRPLRPERVLVLRERPAEGGLDLEVPLGGNGDRYTGHVPLPRAGRWQLVVRAELEDARVERRIALRGPG